MPSLSMLVRLGLLAGFLMAVRRILAPEAPPARRLEPPQDASSGRSAGQRKARTRQRA